MKEGQKTTEKKRVDPVYYVFRKEPDLVVRTKRELKRMINSQCRGVKAIVRGHAVEFGPEEIISIK